MGLEAFAAQLEMGADGPDRLDGAESHATRLVELRGSQTRRNGPRRAPVSDSSQQPPSSVPWRESLSRTFAVAVTGSCSIALPTNPERSNQVHPSGSLSSKGDTSHTSQQKTSFPAR